MNSLNYFKDNTKNAKNAKNKTNKKTHSNPPCLGRELILLKRGLYPFAIVITPSLNREGWGVGLQFGSLVGVGLYPSPQIIDSLVVESFGESF